MGNASMMRSATLSVDPDDDPRSTGPAGAGVRFWAALVVAGIAVAGFGGVVAYGYLAYGDRGEHMPAPLVKADTRPLKIRPDDPGGLNVQHTNMEVFNAGRDQRPPGTAPGLAVTSFSMLTESSSPTSGGVYQRSTRTGRCPRRRWWKWRPSKST
mgnify:CR=1 FL=1